MDPMITEKIGTLAEKRASFQMIKLTAVQAEELARWRSCRQSGPYVSIERAPSAAFPQEIIQRGFCRMRDVKIDMTVCLGDCWAERRPPKKVKSPVKRARGSRAMRRANERKRFDWKGKRQRVLK